MRMGDGVDDLEAIRQLKARYFRTMDTKQWDEMREVFADDVVMDTTASGGGVVTGAEGRMVGLLALDDILGLLTNEAWSVGRLLTHQQPVFR